MKDVHPTQRSIYICIVSPAILMSILWPPGVVAANALAFAVWTALQIFTLLSSRNSTPDPGVATSTCGRAMARSNSQERHFVSVHLPIHDEPPDIVRGTLNALARLSHEAFEVVVIDNNTDDPALWRPVERHCHTLGCRFRFVHCQDVDGAKAGALEIARGMMNVRTTHVAVVDADYQVTSDFLNVALDALEESGAHFAQFPQSYRDVMDQQQNVEAELGDYFDRHAVAADRSGRMLLTGTLSVIDAGALEATGGWPLQTITEDAELAMSLQRAGFCGIFVPHVAGRGLLPPDLHELQSQRHRWIVGNLQTLVRTLGQSLVDRRLLVSAEHLAQLSAWCSFVTIPVVMLMAGVFLTITEISDSALWYQISLIASATIIGQLLVTIWLSRATPGFSFVRWTLALSSGCSTLSGLTMQRIRFRCTRRSSGTVARISINQILVPVLFFAGALCALALSWFMAAVALFLCAFASASTYSLDRVLRASSAPRGMNQHQGISTSHGK